MYNDDDFKKLCYIAWCCDKLNESYFIENEDLKELTSQLNPLTQSLLNYSLVYIDSNNYIEFVELTIEKLFYKMSSLRVDTHLLKRYYFMWYELEYIKEFEGIEELKKLSIKLMDSMQRGYLIKMFDDEAQKNLNDFAGLFNLVKNTLIIEIDKIKIGYYKRGL